MTRFSLLFALLASAAGCVTESNLGDTGAAVATPRWAMTLGGSGDDDATAVAIDSAGNVIVAGMFGAGVSFGTTTATGFGAFVSKRAAADGHELWTQLLGSADAGMTLRDAAIAPDDSIVILGWASNDPTFGDRPISGDEFVAEVDSAGNVRWVTDLVLPGEDTWDANVYKHVAVGDDGEIAVVGVATGALSFPNGVAPATGGAIVAITLDAGGHVLWGRAATSTQGAGEAEGVAITSDGGVAITGAFVDDVTLGATTLTASATGLQRFAARLDGAGDVAWIRQVGPEVNYLYAGQLAANATGGLIAATPEIASLSNDPFNVIEVPALTALDATGDVLWTSHARSGTATLEASVTAPDGALITAGAIAAKLDLGDGPLAGCIYLADQADTGKLVGAEAFGAASCAGATVAKLAATSDTIALAGSAAGVVDLGTGLLPFHGGDDDAVIAVYDRR